MPHSQIPDVLFWHMAWNWLFLKSPRWWKCTAKVEKHYFSVATLNTWVGDNTNLRWRTEEEERFWRGSIKVFQFQQIQSLTEYPSGCTKHITKGFWTKEKVDWVKTGSLSGNTWNFFIPVLLRHNWHITLFNFKVHNKIIWYTYTHMYIKWSSQCV